MKKLFLILMKRIQNKSGNKEKHVTCVDIHISKLINMNSISIKINRTNKKCIQLIALLFPLFVEEQTL